MIAVVADTSPLNYLALIGQVEILRSLYRRVLIPAEVLAELSDSTAPPKVLAWVHSEPAWIEVRAVRKSLNEADMQHLGPGERAAILLAEEEVDVLLLMDDAAGRVEASRRRIPNTGTLGILRAAAVRQLLDLPTALTQLAATNFRAPRSLIDELFAEDLERKRHLGG
jgi:predicted nucleic acid-binding protein